MSLEREDYLPISDYALIGNCETCLLISRDGSIDWGCFPRFDSPSAFCRILDESKGGHFQIKPEEEFTSSREYLRETAILKTRFVSASGEVEVYDFMPMAEEVSNGTLPMITRFVNCTRGSMKMVLNLEPHFNYASTRPEVSSLSDNRVAFITRTESLVLDSNALGKTEITKGLRSTFQLSAGESTYFNVYFSEHSCSMPHLKFNLAPDILLQQTQEYWQKWSSKCSYQGPYREQVLRSALTLKLLTYHPTGAIIAAPTTSLPEEIGGVRNWDYRFTWLRDATFMVDALYASGHDPEAQRFLDWLCEHAKACKEGDQQIAYGIGGEKEAPEKILNQLSGYRNSAPVRVGNHAFTQFQLDTYGELLSCIDSCRRHGHDRETDLWSVLRSIVNSVCDRWQEPDQGIWEVRSGPKHFVHSKVMAWVAVHRAVTAAEEMGFEADLPKWKATCDAIFDEVMEKGWDEKLGSFVQAYDSHVLDASNLRLSLVGFLPASHPRMRSTIERTEQLLMKHGLVYRYLGADDGLPGGEATFAICTFWLIQNFIAIGELDKARQYLDRTLSFSNDLGLFAEEIDPTTKQHLGNFPQGFTHVGVINSIVQLSRAMESQGLRLTH